MCDAETTIHEAAGLMNSDGRSAILVRTRDGLGIVTDVDLREKVVVGRVSRDAPVSAIMSAPVHTIRADTLAAEASIAMLAHGVRHLPVLDGDGGVVGIVSAGDLMSLEARNPFALRHSLQSAGDEDELVAAAGDVPKLFVDLFDARLEASVICRVLTVLHDTMTARLLDLAFARRGAPPVDYAWLVFGSAARNEFTLASDQDNGLAYADTDDPAVDEYFCRVAEDVNAGLARCGIEADPHAVLAGTPYWHKTLTGWRQRLLEVPDGRRARPRGARERVLRLPAGGRAALRDPGADRHHARGALVPATSCSGSRAWARTTARRSRGSVRSWTAWSTSSRAGSSPSRTSPATTRWRTGSRSRRRSTAWPRSARSTRQGAECDRTLREAYLTLKQLQLEHHAEAVRAGKKPDNVIDTDALRPLTRANLQEALRAVAAAQNY